jgi:hypothetical protein
LFQYAVSCSEIIASALINITIPMEEAATNAVEGVHHRPVRLLVGVVVTRIYDER